MRRIGSQFVMMAEEMYENIVFGKASRSVAVNKKKNKNKTVK